MTTNASTWFYTEPEHNAYLLEERVNHTFWSNRISSIYLDCVQAEPPFRMTGEWNGNPVSIEWTPNKSFFLLATNDDDSNLLIVGIKEILGFVPTLSFVDAEGILHAEWYVTDASERIQAIQSDPKYQNIKRYKR